MSRPRIYENAEDMEKDINEYFETCNEKGVPYTICGLANALDIDRKTLLNYSRREEFFHTVKKAKQKVEQQLEENLYRLGNNSGIIFNLKNNFNWKDSIETVDKYQMSKVEELLSKIESEAKDDIKQ